MNATAPAARTRPKLKLHLNGLPADVATVRTDVFSKTRNAIHVAVTLRETVGLFGPAGTGKTLTSMTVAQEILREVRSANPDAPERIVRFQLPESRSRKSLYLQWYRALTSQKAVGTEAELREELVDILSDGKTLTIIDEAQHLGYEGLEQYRWISDTVDDHIPTVLVGAGELADIIGASATLKSRVARHVDFCGIPSDRLIPTLAAYHPIFAGADPGLLLVVSNRFAHYNWRDWARVLQAALRIGPALGFTGPLTEDFARAILDELDPAMTHIALCHLGAPQRSQIDHLRALNDPDRGVVSAIASIDSHGYARAFAADILSALGKPTGARGNGASAIDPWTLVPIWLSAIGTRHLIVIDAQRLGPGRFADLCGLAYELDLHLWLFTHDPLRSLWAAPLTAWPLVSLDWGQALQELPAPPAPLVDSPAAPPAFSLADLPTSDVFTFRADAARGTDPTTFAAIDAHYCACALAASEWAGRTRIGLDTLESYLSDLLAAQADAAQRVVALRGVQAAILRFGWHLGVAIDRFNTLAGDPPAGLDADDARWRPLAGWWQPHRGAVCALVGLGVAASVIPSLTCAMVRPETVTRPDGAVLDIPVPAQRLLAAQLLARLAEGAGPSALFVTAPDGTPVDEDWVADIVRRAEEVGVAIPLRRQGRSLRWHDGSHLFRALGLRLRDLRSDRCPFGTRTLDTHSPLEQPVPRCLEPIERVADPPAGTGALDGAFIRARRLELGMSRRQLARQSGLIESAVSIMETGTLPALGDARRLLKLADALSSQPAQLFAGAASTEPTSATAADAGGGDAAVVGALVQRAGEPVPIETIADILEWSLARVHAAAIAADHSAAGTGLRLRCWAGDISWVPDASADHDPTRLAQLAHRQQLRRGVGLHRVKLLAAVAAGTVSHKAMPEGLKVHMRHLRAARYVEEDLAGGPPRISEAVRYSLLLPPCARL